MNTKRALCVALSLFLVLTIVLSYQFVTFNSCLYLFTTAQKNEQKFVYIDLGANNGDSVYNFLKIKTNSSFQKFPDLLIKNVSDVYWDIYAIEANPIFDTNLLEMREVIKKEQPQHNLFLHNRTAAWTYDGTIDFFLDLVNVDNNYWGSSLKSNHPDVVKSGKQKVSINCIDLARVLLKYDKKDFIFVKMDIEGAEYEMLIHLVKQNVLDLIDQIAIEYHGQLSPFKTPLDVFNLLLVKSNTTFIKWI